MQRVWRNVSVYWVMGLLCVAGCATPSERAAGLAQSAPKFTHESDRGYYAICWSQTPGGHAVPWVGPLRSSQAVALNDAVEHDKEYPGHHAQVKHD